MTHRSFQASAAPWRDVSEHVAPEVAPPGVLAVLAAELQPTVTAL